MSDGKLKYINTMASHLGTCTEMQIQGWSTPSMILPAVGRRCSMLVVLSFKYSESWSWSLYLGQYLVTGTGTLCQKYPGTVPDWLSLICTNYREQYLHQVCSLKVSLGERIEVESSYTRHNEFTYPSCLMKTVWSYEKVVPSQYLQRESEALASIS